MKKKFLFFIPFLLFSFLIRAQETYQINGESYELYTEVEGDLTLLWNTLDKRYHYFIEKNGELTELTNTKQNRKYQEEYKETLKDLTPETDIPTQKVRFTLNNLRTYVKKHNAAIEGNSYDKKEGLNTRSRIGIFGGITNSVYTYNPDNEKSLVAGLEFEIYGVDNWKRHSVFTQLRHSFKDDEFEYSKTEVSFNYRFKIINASWFHLYTEAELIDLYYYDEPHYLIDDNTGNPIEDGNRTDFAIDLPLSLGVGMAFKISNDTYLTLSYNDFVALGKDDNDEFPIDFTAGLKFNL